MLKPTRPHPLDSHPSFRAMIDAAPPVAELARETQDRDLVCQLVIACGELVHGFAQPPDSMLRRAAHHRAWKTIRELDRCVTAARINKRAPAKMLARAQRAIDRADVLVGALLPD